jgi:hypothetical protein
MNYSRPWKGLLKELVELRLNEALLTQYVAVLAGVRRALDDWIPARHFDRFGELMARHGLVVEVDCVFKRLGWEAAASGKELAPTTRAVGARYPDGMDDNPGTEVHVIVSSRADWAVETLKSGWYPIFVDSRMVRKPQVDHKWLGLAFGYPECCVDFFIGHNDWPRFNTLADAAEASSKLRWEANCLLKHSPWTPMFHMPCSFDCPATVEYSERVLAAVEDLDPDYAVQIRTSLKQHFLMVSEGQSYVLTGAADGREGRVTYEKAVFVGSQAPYDRFSGSLAKGNELRVEDGVIFIWNGGELVESLETGCHRGVIEAPMLLRFE